MKETGNKVVERSIVNQQCHCGIYGVQFTGYVGYSNPLCYFCRCVSCNRRWWIYEDGRVLAPDESDKPGKLVGYQINPQTHEMQIIYVHGNTKPTDPMVFSTKFIPADPQMRERMKRRSIRSDVYARIPIN